MREFANRSLGALPGVNEMLVETLYAHGFRQAKDVAEAHVKDLETQARHGVNYCRYWVSEEGGRVFCLVEAPDKESANRVHQEAHGLVADDLVEVQEGS